MGYYSGNPLQNWRALKNRENVGLNDWKAYPNPTKYEKPIQTQPDTMHPHPKQLYNILDNRSVISSIKYVMIANFSQNIGKEEQ